MRSLFVFYLDSFGHTGWCIFRASECWIASKAPLIFSVKNVCGGSPCQFDRIPNHNKNKPLETMGSFWLGWDGKTHPKYGQFHSVGWGPGLWAVSFRGTGVQDRMKRRHWYEHRHSSHSAFWLQMWCNHLPQAPAAMTYLPCRIVPLWAIYLWA